MKISVNYLKKFFKKNNDFISSLKGFKSSKDIEKISFDIKSDRRNEDDVYYHSNDYNFTLISKFDNDFLYMIEEKWRPYKYDNGKNIMFGWENRAGSTKKNEYKGDSGGAYDDKVIFFK